MPNISAHKLLPTTLVGSYPQPDWLIDRRRLAEIVPPRAHARELWRVDPSQLEQAQDDATILAIRDQERAGIDVVTDGEIRRESYSNRFATALDGMDGDNPAQIPSRTAGKVQIGAASGVASWEPGDTATTILQRADDAMYRHKGRIRVTHG